VLESNAGDTGGAYRWLLELVCGGTDAAAHAAAEAAMAAAESRTREVVCHLGPVIFDLGDMSPFKPAALLFRFPLLHVDRPPRGEILHGFNDSIAFAIRGNCQQLEAASGQRIPLLTVSGGMTQSPILARVLADTLAIPVAVATVPESASLGSAILAAVGMGVHPTIKEAVGAMTHVRSVEPDAERVADYAERYRKWREVYDKLRTWTL
jgi:sugar (pentulose or hexulose) kinase